VLEQSPYCQGEIELFLKRQEAVTRCMVYEDYFIVYHSHFRSITVTIFWVFILIAFATLLAGALVGLGSRLLMLRRMSRRLQSIDEPESLVSEANMDADLDMSTLPEKREDVELE
jgi:hypothetical protein